jgi:hypothetical protein
VQQPAQQTPADPVITAITDENSGGHPASATGVKIKLHLYQTRPKNHEIK